VDAGAGPVDLRRLPVEKLEELARRFEAAESKLPARERVSAMQSLARIYQALEMIRLKTLDGRDEWLRSPGFHAEARLLVAVVRDDARALRARLAALGVETPEPPSHATPADEAPSSPADIDELCSELETAQRMREAGEPGLALAHTLALALDTHADAIASLVLDDATRAGRILSLLWGADEALIRGAIERGLALRDVGALPLDSRRVVGSLLSSLGHGELAAVVVGGAST